MGDRSHGGRRRPSALGLGLLGLLGCTRPNPDFDAHDSVAAEGSGSESSSTSDPTTTTSETSASTTDPTGETTTETGETGTDTTETGETGTDTDEPLCEAPLAYADCDSNQSGLVELPWRALGLDCPDGGPATIPASTEFAAVDTASWRVASSFGLAEGPNYGGKLWAARDQDVISGGEGQPEVPPNTSSAILILSTGVLPPPTPEGAVILPAGAQANLAQNQNPDAGDSPLPPEPINPALGSNNGLGGTPFLDCSLGRDCSDSLHLSWVVNDYDVFYDKLWMRFTVTPPAGVHGFVFDIAFFSAEYPDFTDNPAYADTFVAWSSSDSFTGNLTFIGDLPLSASSLHKSGAIAHAEADPALAGTGFEGNGASPWMRVLGPAEPLTPVELTFFLTDLGDATRGSVVLLDNFRWHCGGCGPDTCGLQ